MMNEKRSSRIQQTSLYLKTCFRQFANEKGWKIFISSMLIMILISMVTGDDMFRSYDATRSGAFALICACIWIGIFNSIRSICRERSILKREHRTGLHMSSYLIAHWLYEAVLCLAEAVLMILIVYIANHDHFIQTGVLFSPVLELYITFFLTAFSADALGLMISSIVRDENMAMTVMPFALIIQLIMSGMVFALDGVTEIISSFTISRWGLNAICISADVNHMTLFSNSEYLSTPGHLLQLWLYLILFAVGYAAIAILALEFIDKDLNNNI